MKETGPVFRLLVVADLGAGSAGGPGELAAAGGVDAALAAFAPRLALRVPDRLGRGERELAVDLAPTKLADFAPDALVDGVPQLAGLRRKDESRGGGAGPAPAAVPADPLGALLAQVDLPAGAAALERLPLADLLAGAGEGYGAELERRLLLQAAEIAAAPRWVELESAWRGVAFLAGVAAAHPAVRLELLAASRADFLDVFFERVFRAEHAGEAAVPLSAVVLGYELDRSPEDIETLRHAGRMGESLRVPFLAAVGPAFWGIKQPRLLPNLPDLVRKVNGPEYAKWNGLRREEAALWLCLASGRFALRDGHPGWEGEAGRPLWGSGVYALAAALAQGYAAEGVRFPVTGPSLPGRGAAALEAPLSDSKAEEIARLGLAPLVVFPSEGALGFPAAPVLQAPRRYDKDEATRAAAAVATLSYQAFSGAAAQALQRMAVEVRPGRAAAEVQRFFAERLSAFLGEEAGAPPGEDGIGGPGEGPVEVEVQPDPESPDDWEVIVRLRPRFPISGEEADLVLGCRAAR